MAWIMPMNLLWLGVFLLLPISVAMVTLYRARGKRATARIWIYPAAFAIFFMIVPALAYGFGFHGPGPLVVLPALLTIACLFLAGYLPARKNPQGKSARFKAFTLGLLLCAVGFAFHFLVTRPMFIASSCGGSVIGCLANLKSIDTACEMYSIDNSMQYPARLAQIAPDYLQAVPTCPTAGQDTYSSGYTRNASGDVFTVYCAGSYHVYAGYQPDSPKLDTISGLQGLPHNTKWWGVL